MDPLELISLKNFVFALYRKNGKLVWLCFSTIYIFSQLSLRVSIVYVFISFISRAQFNVNWWCRYQNGRKKNTPKLSISLKSYEYKYFVVDISNLSTTLNMPKCKQNVFGYRFYETSKRNHFQHIREMKKRFFFLICREKSSEKTTKKASIQSCPHWTPDAVRHGTLSLVGHFATFNILWV